MISDDEIPPEGWAFDRDVPYDSPSGDQVAAIFHPQEVVGARRPAIMFVHGGAWRHGGPEVAYGLAQALARRGYVTASISYRKSDQSPWPGPVRDAKAAVRWLRANAASYGADPDRIAMVGMSAGGQLGATTAFTPGQFDDEGGHRSVSSAVQVLVLLAPVTDLTDPRLPAGLREAVAHYMRNHRDAASLRAASPIAQVHSAAPPTLTIATTVDAVVPIDTVRAMHARLSECSVDHELITVDDDLHAFWRNGAGRVVDLMEPFLAARLAPKHRGNPNWSDD